MKTFESTLPLYTGRQASAPYQLLCLFFFFLRSSNPRPTVRGLRECCFSHFGSLSTVSFFSLRQCFYQWRRKCASPSADRVTPQSEATTTTTTTNSLTTTNILITIFFNLIIPEKLDSAVRRRSKFKLHSKMSSLFNYLV